MLQSIGGGCVEYSNHENGLKYNSANPGSGISQWCNNQGSLLKGIVELVSKELNHLAAILHVCAGSLIFMK